MTGVAEQPAAPGAARTASVLAASDTPLVGRYDVALLDLDGVVYLGGHPISGVARALAQAREAGMRLAYVTNNASRLPGDIAALLSSMDVPATEADVITSAQAAARVLRETVPAGAAVLVVGTDALCQAVAEAGLRPVSSAEDRPAAVVQGYGKDVGWRQLAEAMIALRAGASWVATNTDLTLPSVRGPLPGNGSLVGALRLATGLTPVVVGKPEAALHAEAVSRTKAENPLVVGDRLDTDIEGAVRAGTDSLLVLTGVTSAAELIGAPPGLRPTYLSAGLDGLLSGHPVVETGVRDGQAVARCRAAHARRTESGLVLAGGTDAGSGDGAGGDTAADALRALCGVAWAGSVPDGQQASGDAAPIRVRAADRAAEQVLDRLGLLRG